MYKLTEFGVRRLEPNISIPFEEGNKDFQDYKAWLDKGNAPEPEFTLSELKTARSAAIEAAGRQAVEEKEMESRWLASQEKVSSAATIKKIKAATTEAGIEKAFREAMP